MPAMLIGLLGSILPYVLGLAAVVAVYFGIKRKGAVEEREKFEKAQAEAKARQQEKIQEAVKRDTSVESEVRQKIEEIKKPEIPAPDSINPGDIFKF